LISGIDSLSPLVLANIKVPGEHADVWAMNPGVAETTADSPMTTAAVTYALALWCLQAKNSGAGHG
jgi:hypothetical protein